jgi:hypothetical protein
MTADDENYSVKSLENGSIAIIFETLSFSLFGRKKAFQK